MQRIIAFSLAFLVALGLAPLAQAQTPLAVAPLLGSVVRPFDPPAAAWLAGHRGVDLGGTVGLTVVAALDGVVFFAGMVAGRPVISLRHGDRATTYEPVEASVSAGQIVRAGEPIGTLIAGHPCPLEACLHWGLKEGDTYLDPLTLLVGNPIRLIGAASFEATQERAAQLRALGLDGRVSAAGLISPVTGVITSEYGMRVHPLSGAWRFHDGLDIGAPCGAPLVAMASGVVVELRYHPSYGNRLGIDHGLVLGHSLVSSYSHATGYIVRIGQVVVQGELVGYVGTTGDSTGCHLHLETTVDGVSYDPALLIP